LTLLRSRAAVLVSALVFLTSTAIVLGLNSRLGCWAFWDSTPCTRVLFVGNSYTSVNDLPSMFTSLARSGGHRVEIGSETHDGWTLADQAAAPATTAALAATHWNIVVLQEQSQIPAVEQLRQQQMFPAARHLATMVRQAGGQPLFFMTWAHRDGWSEDGLADYSSMQSAIEEGYQTIAKELRAPIAPVGEAWRVLVAQESNPALWQDDGSHPTAKGTYLAACVFYASIFRESPNGLSYRADLTANEALLLQQVAASTVLDDPPIWGMP
jgi:hypothetical protein